MTSRYGPEPPPGLAGPGEPLPTRERGQLVGHKGPVLSVQLTKDGVYCISCGKVGFQC